ncbi:hypothetical protein G9A89_013868 [Geosiphon pyriformis]|nr:hypothetical protein G9A89_013868 [Geosiphon pyriformis]
MSEEAKQYTLNEVSSHRTKSSLYIAVHGKVYDVTNFIDEHPGGEEVLLDEGGKDATEAFDDVGHSEEAYEILKRHYIGELKDAPPPSITIKSTPYEKTTQPESPSNFGIFIPIAVLIAYIAYKYVSQS